MHNEQKHIVIDGSEIILVEYSPLVNENISSEVTYEYIDKFLLYFNFNHLKLASLALSASEMLNWCINKEGNIPSVDQNKKIIETRYLNALGHMLGIRLSCAVGLFRVKRTEYLF